jgi:co-chaperonin GroES (HSP10)
MEVVPKSKYLPFFQENQERIRKQAKLVGDTLLVERIQFPETRTRSGLLVVDSKKIQINGLTCETPLFYRVLLIGEGFYNEETKEDEPLEIKPGHIIHTNGVSVKLWSSFPLLQTTDSDVLGVTRYGDALWTWESEEEFFQFLRDFNTALAAEVPTANE